MINTFFQEIERRLPARLRDVLPLDSQMISRWGIILGVLFFSAVVVPKAVISGEKYLLLLGLLPVFIGLITLLRWPDLGLPLIILSGLLVPFSIGTGTNSSINLSIILVVLLVGLWIFQMIVMRDAGITRLSRPFWPAVAIIVSTLISFGFGQFRWYPIPAASITAQIGGAMIFVLSAGAFLLVAYHLQSVVALRWMVWIFLAIAGFFMLGRAVPSLGHYYVSFFQRAVSDCMFWMWFGVLAYSQLVFNNKLRLVWRIVIGLSLALGLYVALFLQRDWTSGWLPMIAAIGLCTFIARPRYSIFFGIILIAFFVINKQQAEGAVMAGDNTYSLMTRLEAWKITLKIIMMNPIFGLGPANYYWYTALFPILGYYVPFNSHNNYIDILSQTGLIGFGIFLWLCWEIGRMIWRSRNRMPDGFERSFIYGCFGGLFGMMISGMLGDWILPFVYNVGLEGFRASVLSWLFLGGAVALVRLIPSASPGAEDPSH